MNKLLTVFYAYAPCRKFWNGIYSVAVVYKFSFLRVQRYFLWNPFVSWKYNSEQNIFLVIICRVYNIIIRKYVLLLNFFLASSSFTYQREKNYYYEMEFPHKIFSVCIRASQSIYIVSCILYSVTILIINNMQQIVCSDRETYFACFNSSCRENGVSSCYCNNKCKAK